MLSARVTRLLWLPVAFAALGCVPYQTYQQTKRDLETAREAYEDLSRKYNEAMMRLANGDSGASADESELRAQLLKLQRENADLRQQDRNVQPAFSEAEIKAVGVPAEDRGLQLGEALMFAEGSADLKRSSFPVLDRIINVLQTSYPGQIVVIEGHTDNQPLRQTKDRWKYNIRLGYERAQAVFVYFMNHGIGEDQIVIRTYSFNKPINPRTASTKEGRARNRRIVVRRGGMKI